MRRLRRGLVLLAAIVVLAFVAGMALAASGAPGPTLSRAPPSMATMVLGVVALIFAIRGFSDDSAES